MSKRFWWIMLAGLFWNWVAWYGTRAYGCPQGSISYEGACAADLAPEKDVQTYQPSDETAPRSGMPSYQAENIKADMPPSCAVTNNCSDQQAIDAAKEGKRKAGIR